MFLGFKPSDQLLFQEAVQEAVEYNLVDVLFMVPSNSSKERVQGLFVPNREIFKQKLLRDGAYMYVCGSGVMVKDVSVNLEEALGAEVFDKWMEEGRLIEEIF